jgi:hypothetical protein
MACSGYNAEICKVQSTRVSFDPSRSEQCGRDPLRVKASRYLRIWKTSDSKKLWIMRNTTPTFFSCLFLRLDNYLTPVCGINRQGDSTSFAAIARALNYRLVISNGGTVPKQGAISCGVSGTAIICCVASFHVRLVRNTPFSIWQFGFPFTYNGSIPGNATLSSRIVVESIDHSLLL